MRSWGRFILVLLAYGIALLHTAVPHHHQKSGGGVPMISHSGCVLTDFGSGLLERALSTDLGFGHLETFQKGADAEVQSSAADVPLLLIFSNLPQILSPKKILTVFSAEYIEKLSKKLLLLSVSHFRAPPAN